MSTRPPRLAVVKTVSVPYNAIMNLLCLLSLGRYFIGIDMICSVSNICQTQTAQKRNKWGGLLSLLLMNIFAKKKKKKVIGIHALRDLSCT